jgi:ABC-type branched-subunit amino acid transport system substrate-binding protein
MNRRVPAAAAAVALLLAGCAKANSGGQDAAGIKTGPGVTATTIRLGSLVDLTAVFAPLGKSLVQGTQLYWNQQNAAGGVCGRKVEITVKDHGYDPQKAIALYRGLSGDVLGLQTVLGSPVIAALRSSVEADDMFVGFAGWSSSVLPDPHYQLVGTTYDIETINGLDFLLRTKGLKSGDKIGHVYFVGDFGESALRGSEYVAEQKGLTVVKQQIKPTDTDLSAQVAAFRAAGVKAIVVSAGPTQTASVAGVAKSVGLDVPILANGPGFTPQLLATPAGPALTANLYVVSGIAPFSVSTPAATAAAASFDKAYPGGTPTQVGSSFGYVQAQVTKAVLQKACDNKDLTRAGLLTAMHQISALDTGGLVAGTLNYTDPAQPPSRSVYIAKADSAARGGLTAVGPPVEADLAKAYRPAG